MVYRPLRSGPRVALRLNVLKQDQRQRQVNDDPRSSDILNVERATTKRWRDHPIHHPQPTIHNPSSTILHPPSTIHNSIHRAIFPALAEDAVAVHAEVVHERRACIDDHLRDAADVHVAVSDEIIA